MPRVHVAGVPHKSSRLGRKFAGRVHFALNCLGRVICAGIARYVRSVIRRQKWSAQAGLSVSRLTPKRLKQEAYRYWQSRPVGELLEAVWDATEAAYSIRKVE